MCTCWRVCSRVPMLSAPGLLVSSANPFFSAKSFLPVDVLRLEPAHAHVQSLSDQVSVILCDEARTCGSSDPHSRP